MIQTILISNSTKQNKWNHTKRNETKQSKAKQSKAKQSKTRNIYSSSMIALKNLLNNTNIIRFAPPLKTILIRIFHTVEFPRKTFLFFFFVLFCSIQNLSVMHSVRFYVILPAINVMCIHDMS